jgi:hypothetical protein
MGACRWKRWTREWKIETSVLWVLQMPLMVMLELLLMLLCASNATLVLLCWSGAGCADRAREAEGVKCNGMDDVGGVG